jgi:hypothetical protein
VTRVEAGPQNATPPPIDSDPRIDTRQRNRSVVVSLFRGFTDACLHFDESHRMGFRLRSQAAWRPDLVSIAKERGARQGSGTRRARLRDPLPQARRPARCAGNRPSTRRSVTTWRSSVSTSVSRSTPASRLAVRGCRVCGATRQRSSVRAKARTLPGWTARSAARGGGRRRSEFPGK